MLRTKILGRKFKEQSKGLLGEQAENRRARRRKLLCAILGSFLEMENKHKI